MGYKTLLVGEERCLGKVSYMRKNTVRFFLKNFVWEVLFVCLIVILFFETGFHPVAQAGLGITIV